MRIYDGGDLYGFCPAKATWDQETVLMYRTLIVAWKCGTMLKDGSLIDQPSWWIDILAWFVQKMDHELFVSRAKMVLGDEKAAKKVGAKKNGGKSR